MWKECWQQVHGEVADRHFVPYKLLNIIECVIGKCKCSTAERSWRKGARDTGRCNMTLQNAAHWDRRAKNADFDMVSESPHLGPHASDDHISYYVHLPLAWNENSYDAWKTCNPRF